MAKVTLNLPFSARSDGDSFLGWDDLELRVPGELTADGKPSFLDRFQIGIAGRDNDYWLALNLSKTAGGTESADLSFLWERQGELVLAVGAESWTFRVGSDRTDPYTWPPTNQGDAQAARTAIASIASRTRASLTIDDRVGAATGTGLFAGSTNLVAVNSLGQRLAVYVGSTRIA